MSILLIRDGGAVLNAARVLQLMNAPLSSDPVRAVQTARLCGELQNGFYFISGRIECCNAGAGLRRSFV